MEYKWIVPFTILAFILVKVNCLSYRARYVPKPCTRCHTDRRLCCMLMEEGEGICCNGSVSQNVQRTQFSNMRDHPVFSTHYKPSPWSIEFWTYGSFITAAAQYERYGFGTTFKDGVSLGKMEVAALLAHVGSKITCDEVENGGRYIYKSVPCGLCNYKENNTSFNYCDEHYKDIYPCAPGVAYYGRGALPIYWNYNYGEATKDLKDLKVLNVDLLKNPDSIKNNDTLAFLVAIWRWMTPVKGNQPSAHDVFVGNWKPTENDILAKRVSGFGTTMNVLYGDLVCDKGNNETMNKIIKYYQHYLDLIGVKPNEAGPQDLLSCADQRPFNPSVPQSP